MPRQAKKEPSPQSATFFCNHLRRFSMCHAQPDAMLSNRLYILKVACDRIASPLRNHEVSKASSLDTCYVSRWVSTLERRNRKPRTHLGAR